MSIFADKLGKIHQSRLGAILAPMAGITDLAMRRVAQKFGATYVVSEMVDARFCGVSAGRAAGTGLNCHVVQIAGCTAEGLAEAARFAEANGADAIDINMGCPAKKVVGGLAGSALMRDLDQATALIRAAIRAVAAPVTVKMRLGWDDASRNAPELARRSEAEGAAAIIVHGRTRCQFYKGRADWKAIRPVVDAVSIPVVANGDCTSVSDARAMLDASGAAAVMIGRAAIGRPWFVGDVAHHLATGRHRPPLSASQRREAAIEHYAGLLSEFGEEKGVRHARKHLAGYATHAGHPVGTPLHGALVTATSPATVLRALDDLFADDEVCVAGSDPEDLGLDEMGLAA